MAIKRFQHLRGLIAKLTATPLKDGELYLATDEHKVYMGDTTVAAGNFALANEEDLTTLKTDVDNNTQDIADIMTDYAKTAGGNTLTANSVAVSDADGKLIAVTGTAGQVIGFSATGAPEAQTPSGGGAFNKSATATLAITTGTTATVTIADMVADADPFVVIPQWTTAIDDEKVAWNKIISVESKAGSLEFKLSGDTATAVPFTVYWTV